jgi:hypothetical protein
MDRTGNRHDVFFYIFTSVYPLTGGEKKKKKKTNWGFDKILILHSTQNNL